MRNDELSEEAREAYRAYHRQYRRRNREKIKAYNIKYWERVANERAREGQDEDNTD
jgi:hypothetical protein